MLLLHIFMWYLFSWVAELPEVGPLKPEDIEVALRNTRPSAHLHAHRYEKFNQDYGSQILGQEQAWTSQSSDIPFSGRNIFSAAV